MHVVRAESFDRDLDALYASLAELSELAATNTVLRILQACARLDELPHRHPVEQHDPAGKLRRFNIGRYVVLYDVDERRVELVHVVVGARDLRELFSERDQA